MTKIVLDLPPDEYHASEGISSHDLGSVHHSPANYKFKKSEKQKPRDHYTYGTLLHTAVLEPDRFDHSYLIAPDCNKMGNANKERWKVAQEEADESGKLLAKVDDIEEIKLIRDSVLAHKTAAEAIIAGGLVEPSVYATDPETGLLLRARPDLVSKGDAIVDLKTTTFGGASKHSFARSIGKFRYHCQAAFYKDILKLVEMHKEFFVFIVAEKVPPYSVAVYMLDDASIEAGRKQYRADLLIMKEAIEKDSWGSNYSQECEVIRLPEWAIEAAEELAVNEEPTIETSTTI